MSAKRIAPWLIALTVYAAQERDAEACGGCFVPEGVNTQVTAHRMVLSISQTETTLWDQIVYTGEPESFAWVLPTRGVVEVGLSADAMFQALESLTVVTVLSPPACGFAGGDAAGAAASGNSNGSGAPSKGSDTESVEVTAHEVVGPYETVQLSSDDPEALRDWLDTNGYAVPGEIAPIVDQYVIDGFDFLALKLVPGAGVDAMQPVRITTPGAMPALPLRMVAAGTGARAPISLWILAEGRYQAANMPNFLIEEKDLIWNWDEQRSNYTELRQKGFDDTDQRGWLTEVVLPVAPESIRGQVERFALSGTGYGGDDPQAEMDADVVALVGHIDGVIVLNRLYAELSRAALADDLVLEAASDQVMVEGTLQTEAAIGTAPSCPPPRNDDVEEDSIWPRANCAVSSASDGAEIWFLLALFALRRRRESDSSSWG